MLQGWERSEPTTVTKVGYRSLVEKTFILPNGRPYSYTTYYSEGTKAAAVIAVTKDRKVIVARQFRPGPERIMDELPGGMVEAHEEPDIAAMRELTEETGYMAGSMQFLGFCSREAYSNMTSYYYLALDCELASGGRMLEEHEDIEVKLLSIGDFLNVARDGRLTDQAAVLYAYDQLLALKTIS